MQRRALTLRGEIVYWREVRECPRCRRSFAQLDRELRLEPGDGMTLGVARKVAYEAARASFVSASDALKHQLGLNVSAAQCQRLAREYGERLEQFQRDREAQWTHSPVVRTEDRVVLEADATSVLTRSDEDHKMVCCATAFRLDDRVRKEGEPGRPVLASRRYGASGEDFDDFETRFRGLAGRMNAHGCAGVALVADGARCLWKMGEETLPKGTVFIQDYWHVCEHLTRAAAQVHPRDAAQAETTASRWRADLRASRVLEILDELRSARTRMRGPRRRALDEEIGYLESGCSRMDYARYEQEGWPIGSGAVEGTCKHLVKERFHVTGARWRRSNIGPMLSLRLSLFNEEWASDWARIREMCN